MERADKTHRHLTGPHLRQLRADASLEGLSDISRGHEMAQAIHQCTGMRKQRTLIAGIEGSPRQLDQQRRLMTLFGEPSAKQTRETPIQRQANATTAAARGIDRGPPVKQKSDIESHSAISMDKVNDNSSRPAKLNADGYTPNTDIHLAPGQEQHLPHRARHVVQQAQGRVKPTMQLGDKPGSTDNEPEVEADAMGAEARRRDGAAQEHGGTQPLQRRSVSTAAGVTEVVQGRFEFPDDGPMAAWVSKLSEIPSVAGMAEDENFVVRFESEEAPNEQYEGYTRDQGNVLVIGLNTARIANEGQALHILTHELVLHAEAAWGDDSLENVLDTETIRAQHEEIIEQRVAAPDHSLVDGSYRNAQRIVVATLAERNDYQALGEFVSTGMSEQYNVMLLTLQNHFAHADESRQPNSQYGRAFTSGNLTKTRNNVVLAWNDFLQTMQLRREQHIMHGQLIDQVIDVVRGRKNEVVAQIDQLRQGAVRQGL